VARLEAANIPSRLMFSERAPVPAGGIVVVQVMNKLLRHAHEIAVSPVLAEQHDADAASKSDP
jgi:hypothetical protein